MSSIAVDFGTDNTVIARRDGDDPARPAELPGISRAVRYRTGGDSDPRTVHLNE